MGFLGDMEQSQGRKMQPCSCEEVLARSEILKGSWKYICKLLRGKEYLVAFFG